MLKNKLILPDIGSRNIKSILLIKFRALGDIALTLPVIYILKKSFPSSHLSYLLLERFRGALSGNDCVDEIITFKDYLFSEMKLISSITGRKFDLVIDMTSSPFSAYVTFLTRSVIRIGYDIGRFGWCYTHLVPRFIEENGVRVKMYTFDSNLHVLKMLGLDVGLLDRMYRDNGIIDGLRNSTSPVGLSGDRYSIGFPPAGLEEEWADSFFSEYLGQDKRLIGIVPGSNYQAKGWPVDRFIEVSKRIENDGIGIPVILWGPGERDIAVKISDEVESAIMIPQVGIEKLGAIISRLDMVVGVDSGPKHIAVLLGVPTVTLFGPTDPEIWDPRTDFHRVIYRNLECSPCRKKQCNPNSCMLEIHPEDVIDEIVSVLSKMGKM